jgi:hypothetical protein
LQEPKPGQPFYRIHHLLHQNNLIVKNSIISGLAVVNIPEIDIICGYEKNVNISKKHNNAQQSIKSLKSKTMIKANLK